MTSDPSAFEPSYAVPPGESLLETIMSLGLTQADLAARTGRPKKTINEIINGKAAITAETALQLEKVLGVKASFWNALEQQYRAALAHEAERERLEAHLEWLKKMPVKSLIKQGWVASFKDPVQQLDAFLRFFGVASPAAWQDVWSALQTHVSYRKAQAFETDFPTVTAWLRYGELLAREIETEPYDASTFRETLQELRALTLDTTTAFVDVLVQTCAACGVAVCFVPELPKLRVCGATRWLSSDKASIQLSLRYKTNDHLWFTFFHEAGHILLHGKRSIFVEEENGASRASLGATEPEKPLEYEEEEANEFAQEILIPSAEYDDFVSALDFSASAIRHFAQRIAIDPAIVLGRLQRDRHVPFPTPMNRLFKRSYRFSESS